MPAKFVVKKGSTGKFRFNLLATNGKVIATSEAYESKRAVLGGIDSVRQNAPDAEIDDQAGGKPISDKATGNKATGNTAIGSTASTSKRAEQRESEERDERDDARNDRDGEPDERNEDQQHSAREMEVNLGPCHYGDTGEEATMTASRADGTGWIAVCEQHVDKARQDGFEPDASDQQHLHHSRT